MIYDSNTTKQSRAAAIAFAQNPPARVTFSPVQHKLLRVTHAHGDEHVFADTAGAYGYGDYAGLRFDPWRKGDLVAVCNITRTHYLKGPATTHETWRVCVRATTPAHVRQAYAFTDSTDNYQYWHSSDNLQLWRITYRHLQAAHKLLGLEFETREALEHALEHGAQSFAIAAE